MKSHEDPGGVCHEKHSQRGSLLMHEDWDEFFISHCLMFDVLTLMLKESVQKLPRRNMEVMS